jgi:hypothetical protein
LSIIIPISAENELFIPRFVFILYHKIKCRLFKTLPSPLGED